MLYAFYDDELNQEEKNLVEAHLKSCKECNLEMESWKKIGQMVFSKPVIQHQEKFVQKVMGEIEKRSEVPANSSSNWLDIFSFAQWKIAFALSMLLFVLIYPLDRNGAVREEINPGEILLGTDDGLIRAENWLFSDKDIKADDFLKIVFENEESWEADSNG